MSRDTSRQPTAEKDGGGSSRCASRVRSSIVVEEGQPARQQLEHDDADAVQVAAIVDLVATHLFRGDVLRRAAGDGRFIPLEPIERDVDLVGQLGQAEVHDLDELLVRIGIDQHQVGGLQVAVDDADAMGGLQGGAQVGQPEADPLRRKALVGLQHLLQVAAGHVFHDDAQALGIAGRGIEQGDDVVVLEAGHELHFPLEQLAKLGLAGNVVVHHLDDDRLAIRAVAGQVDLAHGAFAQRPHHLVLAQEHLPFHGPP